MTCLGEVLWARLEGDTVNEEKEASFPIQVDSTIFDAPFSNQQLDKVISAFKNQKPPGPMDADQNC